MTDSSALRAVLRGRVQMVGFRWFACEAAERLGVAGWVRNRPDGAVEVLHHGGGHGSGPAVPHQVAAKPTDQGHDRRRGDEEQEAVAGQRGDLRRGVLETDQVEVGERGEGEDRHGDHAGCRQPEAEAA